MWKNKGPALLPRVWITLRSHAGSTLPEHWWQLLLGHQFQPFPLHHHCCCSPKHPTATPPHCLHTNIHLPEKAAQMGPCYTSWDDTSKNWRNLERSQHSWSSAWCRRLEEKGGWLLYVGIEGPTWPQPVPQAWEASCQHSISRVALADGGPEEATRLGPVETHTDNQMGVRESQKVPPQWTVTLSTKSQALSLKSWCHPYTPKLPQEKGIGLGLGKISFP